jgi:CDP-glycerol glycerophosphotransferase (TagB/SpsB family)
MSDILESISSFCIILLTIIFMPITRIIRRNDKIWIFGSIGGNEFVDNPKHFFLHISKYHKEVKVIWLSVNKKLIFELKRNGYQSYHIYSIQGFYYSFIAKYFIFSNFVLTDINYIPSVGGTRINLWHGIPIKKIGEDAADMGFHGSVKTSNILKKAYVCIFGKAFHYIHKTTHYFIACSDEHQNKMCSAFDKSKGSVPVTGYPRNDALFFQTSVWDTDNLFWNQIKNTIEFKYLFTYLPTFRDTRRYGLDLFTPFGFDSEYIHEVLEKLNAVLIIKSHAVGTLNELPGIKSPRIIFVSNSQLPDVYPLLNKTDILLTDFSSVYLDYLLLDRPIIFTPFDLKEYVSSDRQLYYDYNEVTPGPKAQSWPEAFELIKEILEKDNWKSQRELVRNRFHQYIDGNSSERVYRLIMNLSGKTRK